MSNSIIFSIVIPAFNEERYIRACLDSVFSLNFPRERYEVIVIDNGSTDKTIEYASNYETQCHTKLGVKVGAVRNFGASIAKGEFIAFLDSDCVVDPEWLNTALKKLLQNPKLVIGGQYLMRESPSWLEKYWVLNNSTTQIYQTTLVGGCIFVPKATFHEVNGFNEALHSGEDSDLTYRLRKSGFNVEICPKLSVIHLGYPSDVNAFIKRQLWHSADYITNIKKSIKDKIFAITLLFFSAFIATIIGIICTHLPTIAIAAAIMAVTPATLSYKRISRSKTSYRSIVDLFLIYCVDVLYLTGRSLGTLISLRNSIFVSLNEKKISR